MEFINQHLTLRFNKTGDTQFKINTAGVIPGLRGEQGPPGTANSVIGIDFQYNQVSPVVFPLTIPAGKLVLECRLIITTPFDGVGATLALGTILNPSEFISPDQCDPVTSGCYTTYPFIKVNSEISVLLTVQPGTDASQGAGLLFVYFED